jgi:hypothetical protein
MRRPFTFSLREEFACGKVENNNRLRNSKAMFAEIVITCRIMATHTSTPIQVAEKK